jgi:ATP-dependent exoDNAse (exonuclease V) beta subunit
MQSANLKPFKILNASAGSGKTYTLVKEYLLLLLQENNSNKQFAHCIAMTFTNMAAIEMKERIIQYLDLLSYPKNKEAESFKYAEELGRILGVAPLEVQSRAKNVLKTLLHHYEDFHVLTIDKFNLRLIRSFSRDLDLPNDFEVIMNEQEVIEHVIDLLFDRLQVNANDELSELVFTFAKSNLDEGEKWNFRAQLIEFSSLLTKEKNIPYIDTILATDFSMSRYHALLRELKEERQEYISLCKNAHEVFSNTSIAPSQLPGAQSSWNKLNQLAEVKSPDLSTKLLNSYILDAMNGKVLKSGKVFPEELKNALLPILSWIDVHLERFKTKELLSKSFFNMALLKYIASELHDVKKEQQLIRISEFNQLIANLVQHEEAPYIYERLGSRFRHFLLDEFQDTSRLQWLNIVPLIHESTGHGQMNLIVGDPKQSIYRFKNGVAEQFIVLPEVYNPEKDPKVQQKSDYLKSMGSKRELEDNWRSSPEIVEFNNTLFTALKNGLNDEAQRYYSSINQHVKSTQKGYIELQSRPLDDTDLIQEIVGKIESCKADGFALGDICILVERNLIGNWIAIELNKRQYKVVSADSLLLAKDRKVQLVLSYLKRRVKPSSITEQKRFADLFFRLNSAHPIEAYDACLIEKQNQKGRTIQVFDEGLFLKTAFGDPSSFYRPFESIYELTQHFYSLMQWNELENPFLHHFADFVHDFELSKGPDIEAMLTRFERQKDKLAIQLPESSDAIQIMTIHKSKGLEFPVVILPHLGFSLTGITSAKYLISSGDNIIYSTLSKENIIKAVSDAAKLESDQVFIDKLNLLYVGLTRPRTRLYGFNLFKEKNTFGKLIHQTLSNLYTEAIDGSSLQLKIGSPEPLKHTESKETTDLFYPDSVSETLWYPEIALADQFSYENNDLSEEQRKGTQFHLAMARIDRFEDISSVLNSMRLTGEIEQENIPFLHTWLSTFFKLPEVLKIYENKTDILTEQSIILDELSTKRPDKIILKQDETIILDFKTGMPKNDDVKQLVGYKDALIQMDLPNIKSYLYYTSTHELIAV